MAGVSVALNKEEAQTTFFDAMRRNLASIKDQGESSWCKETLRAAKARHSKMLTSDEPAENEQPQP
jgi:hypothetical protein